MLVSNRDVPSVTVYKQKNGFGQILGNWNKNIFQPGKKNSCCDPAIP